MIKPIKHRIHSLFPFIFSKLFQIIRTIHLYVIIVIPKAVGRYLFNRIRDLKTIEQFLEATYSRKEALTPELVRIHKYYAALR